MPAEPPSSPDIVPISPPPVKKRSNEASSSSSDAKRLRTATPSTAKMKGNASPKEPSRARLTEKMLNSLKSAENPIAHSDAFERTAHIHSCSTGHQQRGGDRGFWAAARDAGMMKDDLNQSHTYWSVRTAKVEAQSRDKKAEVFSGCVIAINGHTGPVSNLQLQNLITTNGGRFSPHTHSGCTHVIASRLSGTKTQKHINGQGTRGASRRTKVVRVEWVIDSASQGKRLSEAGYGVVSDPTQKNLFTALGVKPKAELRAEASKLELASSGSKAQSQSTE